MLLMLLVMLMVVALVPVPAPCPSQGPRRCWHHPRDVHLWSAARRQQGAAVRL
jgi:hypothetical protein